MECRTTFFLLLVTIVLVADCQVKKPEGKPKGDKDKPKGDKGGKPSKEKIEKWKENRSKPNNGERKAGGAKLGLFKKGAAFEMDRKNKAIRFEIFDIVETRLDNTSKVSAYWVLHFILVRISRPLLLLRFERMKREGWVPN